MAPPIFIPPEPYSKTTAGYLPGLAGWNNSAEMSLSSLLKMRLCALVDTSGDAFAGVAARFLIAPAAPDIGAVDDDTGILIISRICRSTDHIFADVCSDG